ncbi:MAG TPA: polysaccharide deacetylase family protein [Candidatus Acidoferrales bacterium]
MTSPRVVPFQPPSSVFVRPTEFAEPAIRYSVKEIARRAGVAQEFWESWRVDCADRKWITVFPVAGSKKQIRFPRASGQFWENLRNGIFQTSSAPWMHETGSSSGSDLLVRPYDSNGGTFLRVPFSSSPEENVGPLFSSTTSDCIRCAVDLPTAAFLTLSRFEETLQGRRDPHGRFSVFSTIAWREGFLDRPIVDEWGMAFEQALSRLLPNWKPATRRLRVNLSHDVDNIGIPFRPRSSAGHALRRGKPLAALRDLAAQCRVAEPAYFRLLNKMISFASKRGLRPMVNWKAPESSLYDTGYDVRDSRVGAVISAFRARGFEMGIHPSYGSFASRAKLAGEVAFLQDFFEEKALGGRQHYLRWTPALWEQWDDLGLAYDSSVGFADGVGFRAGTCYPYHPWLASQNRQAKLLEIPLIVMDSALKGYMKLAAHEALTCARELLERCRAVGGVFSLLWHNTTLMDSKYTGGYLQLLNDMANYENYTGSAVTDGVY